MRVNISLHDGVDLDRFSDQLTETGIRVSKKMEILNMLTAEIPDQTTLHQVRAMKGVRAAEPDRQVHAV
jgi:hypothetical protein